MTLKTPHQNTLQQHHHHQPISPASPPPTSPRPMIDQKSAPAASVPPSITLSTSTPPTTSSAPSPSPSPKPPSTPASKAKDSKKPKDVKPAKDAKQPATDAKGDDSKLSAKEIKEKKKADKAARRAESKAAVGAPPPQPGPKSLPKDTPQKGGKGAPPPQPTSVNAGGIVKIIYSTNNQVPIPKVIPKEAEVAAEPPKDKGLVGLLKDLAAEQNEKKKTTVFGLGTAHPDVHPAILTLGMQINQYVLTGSTARCLGFLLAMKRVIHDYSTPPNSTLSRHLPGHYLSHQIAYLLSARPMSTAMGNTIRWLKQEISTTPPERPQESAKKDLMDKIDNFIREKITLADDMIVNTTVARYLKTGDVVLTYGKSQVVERALLEAHRRGKRFRVIIVDNRPLLEGKNLLRGLCQAGISCEYIHLYALDYSIAEATRVLLGAHAVMADGALYSRSGTAAVALAARDRGIPVVVCCESIKFSDKINMDGIVFNELGDPELLTTLYEGKKTEQGPLQGWKDMENTRVDSFRYDVTPREYIKMVICEHGCVAPNSVASVLRSSSAASTI